jgi:hypothetical protein
VTDPTGADDSQPTLLEVPYESGNPNDSKTCGTCGKSLALESFGVHARYASGLISYHGDCKKCCAHHKKVIEHAYTSGLYVRLYAKQDGRCFVCCTWHERLCVDHDHKTQKVRALLCSGCNKAAGFIKDNPVVAHDLYLYLAHVEKVRASLGLGEA